MGDMIIRCVATMIVCVMIDPFCPACNRVPGHQRAGESQRQCSSDGLLCRPSFVEISVAQSLPFQSRVTEHFLASYQASFIAVCSAQFGDKAFVDGMEVSHPIIKGSAFGTPSTRHPPLR